MHPNLTDTIQDYLKTIYKLTLCEGRANTNQIANCLGVTPASVSGMIKRLAANDPPLLEYQKHRGVKLTPTGEHVALETLRRHRLLELFLCENLGYTWDEVHQEADRLEHVISEDFEERIDQALGRPAKDPHGAPIPTSDLKLPPPNTLRLLDLRPPQTATVCQVEDDDPDLLRHLAELGLLLQASLTVLDYSPFDENLSLEIIGQTITLGPRITSRVFVDVA